MSGITVPTIDQISGTTVMTKLRNLISKFITFAEEVNDKIDEPLEQAQQAVRTANTASSTANSASASARSTLATVEEIGAEADETLRKANNALTQVGTYNNRLTTLENTTQSQGTEIGHLGIETRDLYDRVQNRVTYDELNTKLTDGSVTKIGRNTVGSASKPIYLVNGVPNVATNVIDMNSIQSIVGIKTFERDNGRAMIVMKSTVADTTNPVYQAAIPRIQAVDKNDIAIATLVFEIADGGAKILRIADAQHVLGATPTDSAPSNAFVTKANVMSTDGKLNNLVHTIGTETISGKKVFNGHLEVNGTYTNKTVNALISGSSPERWTRLYHTGENTDLSNQVLMFTITGQKGNSDWMSGILIAYLSGDNLAIKDLIGSIRQTEYQRVCAVHCTDGRYEIWGDGKDGNSGIILSRLMENNWGSPSNFWVADGVTKQETFDPTDTSLYSAYTYIGDR